MQRPRGRTKLAYEGGPCAEEGYGTGVRLICTETEGTSLTLRGYT